MKKLLLIPLLCFSSNSMAEWENYFTRKNGDAFFYDKARVERTSDNVNVWNRIQYTTSVMAASSYESHLRIGCTDNSMIVLQSTFFTDKNWSTPAMATNTREKPKEKIKEGSAIEHLADMLCKDR